MITVGKVGGQVATKITELYGLSTDVPNLPTDVPNASSFYAMDTFDVYMFDKEHEIWILQQ